MEEVVRKQRVPRGRGKVDAPLGARLIRREGRAGSAMPLHVAKVRSGNRGPEGAADERHSSLGARRERDVTEPSQLIPVVGPGGTDYAVKLLTLKAETSLR